MEETLEGGCLCGAIRYRLTGPFESIGLCHCRSCRLAAGTAGVGWVVVARAQFDYTSGQCAPFNSSPGVTRGFCARCGSTLSYENADAPHLVEMTLGTLDRPDSLVPTREIWLDDKPGWEAVDKRRTLYRHGSDGF